MSEGKASIRYLGHATVIIKTEAGRRIIIDPFLDGNPLCPEDLRDPGPIDYICLTHGHDDHASSAVTLAKSCGAMVFATFELATLLVKDGVPESNMQFMNKGGTVRIPDGGGLAVTLTNAFHSSSYTSSNGETHYAGEAAGLIITLESGRTIYHAGDTQLFSDMLLIGAQYRPTVALLPIGDRFTMGPRDAAAAAGLVEAEVVIPIHHSTFPALSGRPEEFKEALVGSKSRAEILAPGAELQF